MRTREEIQSDNYGSSYEESQDNRLNLILEVILDIRDLLTKESND